MTVIIIFATMEACSFTPRSSYRANSRYTFTIFPTTRGSKLQRINSRGTYVMRAFYGRNNFQSTSSCRLEPHEITLVSRRRECPRYSGTRIPKDLPALLSRALIISDHKSATGIRRRFQRFSRYTMNGSRVRGTEGILMSGQVKNYLSALMSR